MESQETRTFSTAKDWEEWLAENHASSSGLWLKMAKRDTGIASVNYAQALDVALCYGWIDGQKKSFDAQYWLQRFTPRRPKSNWSKVNREHIARLAEAGRMQPSGLKQVEAAKADGRWDVAYDSPSNATVSEDFQKALDRNPKAHEFFLTLSKANRYSMLYRIQTAKKAETRERRIREFVALLEQGQTLP